MPFKHCIICKNKIKSRSYTEHYEQCRIENINKLEQIFDNASHAINSVENESGVHTEKFDNASHAINTVENESGEHTEQELECENESETSESKKNARSRELMAKFSHAKGVKNITEIRQIMIARAHPQKVTPRKMKIHHQKKNARSREPAAKFSHVKDVIDITEITPSMIVKKMSMRRDLHDLKIYPVSFTYI